MLARKGGAHWSLPCTSHPLRPVFRCLYPGRESVRSTFSYLFSSLYSGAYAPGLPSGRPDRRSGAALRRDPQSWRFIATLRASATDANFVSIGHHGILLRRGRVGSVRRSFPRVRGHEQEPAGPALCSSSHPLRSLSRERAGQGGVLKPSDPYEIRTSVRLKRRYHAQNHQNAP